MEFNERLKARRRELGLTQGQLAEAAAVSRVAVGNYERGDRIPPTDITLRLASALRVSVDYLLGHTNIPLKNEPSSGFWSFGFELFMSSLGYAIGGDDSEGYLWIQDKRQNASFEIGQAELRQFEASVAAFASFQIQTYGAKRREEK